MNKECVGRYVLASRSVELCTVGSENPTTRPVRFCEATHSIDGLQVRASFRSIKA